MEDEPLPIVDSRGRVTIPRKVRSALGLRPGDRIDFVEIERRSICNHSNHGKHQGVGQHVSRSSDQASVVRGDGRHYCEGCIPARLAGPKQTDPTPKKTVSQPSAANKFTPRRTPRPPAYP
ncbi:MAG: AbrB/MazE/SpoVT family DNA-binding domain-containing protein [Candidatus Sulfotelmatobacter sp.]